MDVLTDSLSCDLKVSFKEIKLATKDFTTKIGEGGYGHVFKGELLVAGNLTTVAVKRLQVDNRSGQGLKEFLTEIQLLSRCKHVNLVSLVGFGEEQNEKVLIYEYAKHGSLDKYISVTQTTNRLTWKQRINICIDAARGLDYLHNHVAENQRIIHRDIKSANILLDHNFKAMIADFGLSKIGRANENQTFLVTNACGTGGYCDPVYITSGILTKESDVYSFGIVLFEVLCGRLCIINVHDERRFLSQLAQRSYREGKLSDIIPHELKKQMGPASMNIFSEIAYKCLDSERRRRPSISLVLQKLEEAFTLQENYEADKEREKGNEYFKQKEFLDAINQYTECLRINPNDVKAYSNRAACYTELLSLQEGLKDAEKCIDLDPSSTKGYSRKGVIEFLMKEYAKALETYNEGLKYDPQNDALQEGVKICKEEIRRASGYVTPDEEDDPHSEIADKDLEKGNQYFEQGNYVYAIRHYKYYLRNYQDAEAYANRAACYKKLGNMELGLKDAEKCILLDPELPHGYIEKSSILFSTIHYREALKTCNQGLKYDPTNEDLKGMALECTDMMDHYKINYMQ